MPRFITAYFYIIMEGGKTSFGIGEGADLNSSSSIFNFITKRNVFITYNCSPKMI